MKEIYSGNCPLCGNPAEYQFADYENRKHFRCANCSEFQISTRCQFRVAKGPAEWRSSLAKMARQHPEGATLVMTVPGGQRDEGVAYSSLSAEYVRNGELPK